MAKHKQSTQDFLRDLQKLGDPRKIETENIRRSDHNDFATTAEIAERKFSGWRKNSLLNVMELWVHGTKQGEVTISAITGEPDFDKMAELQQKVFAL